MTQLTVNLRLSMPTLLLDARKERLRRQVPPLCRAEHDRVRPAPADVGRAARLGGEAQRGEERACPGPGGEDEVRGGEGAGAGGRGGDGDGGVALRGGGGRRSGSRRALGLAERVERERVGRAVGGAGETRRGAVDEADAEVFGGRDEEVGELLRVDLRRRVLASCERSRSTSSVHTRTHTRGAARGQGTHRGRPSR